MRLLHRKLLRCQTKSQTLLAEHRRWATIVTVRVILLEPEKPGNIGAIARSMKNFDLRDLVDRQSENED